MISLYIQLRLDTTVVTYSFSRSLVAALGAFITIVALGIGTFVQQALNYDTIYTASGGNALMPIAQYMSGVGSAPMNNKGTIQGVDSVLTSAPYLASTTPLVRTLPRQHIAAVVIARGTRTRRWGSATLAKT